jgi:NAD(P)H-hydrate epimerase
VIDADGLNALASQERSERVWTVRPKQVVITPHPGEAARLLDFSAREVQADRLGAARRLAGETGTVVLLKGHRSLVAAPDGRVAVNASGNPGMATAGSGDVLTGIVGSFLARGLDAWDAARLAVFAHGAAGDLAADLCGQEGLIASDIVNRLPEALDALVGSHRARG